METLVVHLNFSGPVRGVGWGRTVFRATP